MLNSRSSRLLGLALLGLMTTGTCLVPKLVRAQDVATNALITELQGGSPAPVRTPEQELAAYTRALDALLPDMADADLNKRGDVQDKWEKIALRAGRPGAEADRVAASQAMLARLTPATSLDGRRWLLKQLEHIGGAEAVPTLVSLLNDPEPLIREGSRRALTKNSSPAAAQALRAALDRADTPEWRIAIINSLGQRQDAASIPVLTRYARDTDIKVAAPAIAALSNIGGPAAIQALNTVKANATGAQRKRAIDALLLDADKLVQQGTPAAAATIYQSLYIPAESKDIRIAALRGLVKARGEAAMPLISEQLAGTDDEMRVIASRLIDDVPGAATTRAFAALLPKLPADGQLALIDELGARGDAAARSAIVDATKSKNENVRLAALRALGQLGNATDVTFLAQAAATTTGAENEAARASLARLHGANVNAALLQGLNGGTPKVRIELIHALSARYASGAVTPLVATLQDPDPGVRGAAVTALGTLGNAQELPALVTLLGKTQNEDQRGPLTDAIAAIIGNMPDKGAAGAPVLAGLQGADNATRLALLPLLKSIGGTAALDAVRAAAKSPDAELQTTAIRTLASWPDATPLADLVQIAKIDPNEAHQVIALRGYADLLKKSDAAPAEKVRLYRDALASTKRNDVQTALLSGLGEVSDPDALKLAASYLDDAALRESAASAVVRIAGNIGGAAGPDLKPLMRRVIATSKNEATTKAASDVMNLADVALRGWEFLGPFPADNFAESINKDFGPEKGFDANQGYPAAGATLHWRPIAIQPNGLAALEKQINPHENVVGYAHVYVKSPTARQAIMSVGSDDGIRAWLNGKQVISDNVNRAATPDQDEAKVDLKAGWNEILLKITQGGGEWGYYFDLLDDQKHPMADLTYAARPQD